jgi:hypothetical protein
MSVERDIYEFTAKSGYDILGVEFESKMTNLPKTNNAGILLPVHCYLYADHQKDKTAVAAGATQTPGEYNIAGYYFDDAGGTKSAIYNDYGDWRKQTIEMDPGDDSVIAMAENDYGSIMQVGYVSGVNPNEFPHLDVMTEIQIYNPGNFDLPDVDPNDNTTIINFVKTQNGWKRPKDVLKLRSTFNNPRDEQKSILKKSEDSWGRFWFNHGVDGVSQPP